MTGEADRVRPPEEWIGMNYAHEGIYLRKSVRNGKLEALFGTGREQMLDTRAQMDGQ
jgi:hypothetical protein